MSGCLRESIPHTSKTSLPCFARARHMGRIIGDHFVADVRIAGGKDARLRLQPSCLADQGCGGSQLAGSHGLYWYYTYQSTFPLTRILLIKKAYVGKESIVFPVLSRKMGTSSTSISCVSFKNVTFNNKPRRTTSSKY